MLTIENTGITLQQEQQVLQQNEVKHHHRTVVICGQCGAEEKMTNGNQTECPNCDDYIY